MKEIEILVEVFEDKNSVIKKLKKYNQVGTNTVTDVYFFDPKRTDLQANEQGGLDRCFRLRQKNNKNYIAYKIDNFDDHGQWIYSDEHEIEVSSFEESKKIINLLGLEELVTIKNTKHTFEFEDYEIVLEEVENLGLFLEVEKLRVPDEIDVDKAKKEIWEFIKNLNIKTSKESNIGKPELMLNKINQAKKLAHES